MTTSSDCAERVDVAPTDLLGTWTMARRVHDRTAGIRGRVRGTVEFVPDGADVRWVEHGELSWDGRTFEVGRELLITSDGDGWMVRFDDGREFHRWTPGRSVIHPCRADVYRGHIDVDPTRTSLRVLWDVTGPAKDQRIVTRCARASGGLAS